jgi:hypothetical protein
MKARGKIRLTAEALADLLGLLPPEVEIRSIKLDENREIIDIIISSEEPVETVVTTTYTVEVAEGAEIPVIMTSSDILDDDEF